MNQWIYDRFAQELLEALLLPCGEFKVIPGVAGEEGVWFAPFFSPPTELGLGWLQRSLLTPALVKPFRDPPSENQICHCLLQLLRLHDEFQQGAEGRGKQLAEFELPRLWLLTPTVTPALTGSFGALPDENLRGIYWLAPALRGAIAAIHQLPATPETLWLRLFGRGEVQQQAIAELAQLPETWPLRERALAVLRKLGIVLAASPTQDWEDRELVATLSAL